MQYNLLVLGPMEVVKGDAVIRRSNVKRLGEILGQMSESLAENGVPPFRIVTPEGQAQTVIEEMVLNEIEQADLLVIDLSGGRPNVAYEAAIIHTLGIPHIFVSADRAECGLVQVGQEAAGVRKRLGARRPDLRRIVVEPLRGNPVAKPDLQRQLVQRPHLPVRARHLEHPIDDHAIAVDEEGLDAVGAHGLQARQNGALVLDERLPPHPRRQAVLLHRCVRVVEILDRPDVFASLDKRDEFLNALATWHGNSLDQVSAFVPDAIE